MLAVFREDDEEASLVNVKPFVALLHSTAEGLACRCLWWVLMFSFLAAFPDSR